MSSIWERRRKRRIDQLLEKVKAYEDTGIERRRLIGFISYTHGLQAKTVEGYLDVLESAGLVDVVGDKIYPLKEDGS